MNANHMTSPLDTSLDQDASKGSLFPSEVVAIYSILPQGTYLIEGLLAFIKSPEKGGTGR